MNEVITYDQKPMAMVEQYRGNYVLTVPGVSNKQFTLKRDQDFGLIRNKKGEATVKKPVLFKSGSEAVFKAYGVFADYITESAIEQAGKEPFFFYRVKCEVFTYAPDGRKIVVGSGLGSANTAEPSNGFATPYSMANSALKKARKRAAVDAAINLAGLSGMFSQDQENEDFMNNVNEIKTTLNDESPVTTKQLNRLYAIAGEAGFSAPEAKQKIIAAGFASTKDIKQKDYERVCKLFQDIKPEQNT